MWSKYLFYPHSSHLGLSEILPQLLYILLYVDFERGPVHELLSLQCRMRQPSPSIVVELQPLCTTYLHGFPSTSSSHHHPHLPHFKEWLLVWRGVSTTTTYPTSTVWSDEACLRQLASLHSCSSFLSISLCCSLLLCLLCFSRRRHAKAVGPCTVQRGVSCLKPIECTLHAQHGSIFFYPNLCSFPYCFIYFSCTKTFPKTL